MGTGLFGVAESAEGFEDMTSKGQRPPWPKCPNCGGPLPCACVLPHESPAASETQVGGDHYKMMPIQPVEFCQKNGLGYCESAVVKYVSRHDLKGGKEDLLKAIHYLQLLIELEYPEAKP